MMQVLLFLKRFSYIMTVYKTFCFIYRIRSENVWQKAVDWIANSDSRVGVESRMITGEQLLR